MTRKYSEGVVRKALAEMDLELYAYKPPDSPGQMQNPKPADFIVWHLPDNDAPQIARAAWIEVKSTPAVNTLNLMDRKFIRPGQLAAMRRARELGLPYLVVVHWERHKRWTITTGPRVLLRIGGDDGIVRKGNYYRGEMPIDCATGQLTEQLRAALLGEID